MYRTSGTAETMVTKDGRDRLCGKNIHYLYKARLRLINLMKWTSSLLSDCNIQRAYITDIAGAIQRERPHTHVMLHARRPPHGRRRHSSL